MVGQLEVPGLELPVPDAGGSDSRADPAAVAMETPGPPVQSGRVGSELEADSTVVDLESHAEPEVRQIRELKGEGVEPASYEISQLWSTSAPKIPRVVNARTVEAVVDTAAQLHGPNSQMDPQPEVRPPEDVLPFSSPRPPEGRLGAQTA